MAEALVVICLDHFRCEMEPVVETGRDQQCPCQPKRRGHRKEPLVTGHLIGIDST
jgi:hypothetical protein